jgi:hypothetical protein
MPGYWGPTVGFYAGVRYVYGYGGSDYDGGYWNGRMFYYNRVGNNPGGLHANAAYDHALSGGRGFSRVSCNGGAGGARDSVPARTIWRAPGTQWVDRRTGQQRNLGRQRPG